MRKRHLILFLALTMVCLSGCHNNKDNVKETEPLATIAPDEVKKADEDINDKLDETAADLELGGYTLGPDGRTLTGEEALAYEMEMIYGVTPDELNNESGTDSSADSTETDGSVTDDTKESTVLDDTKSNDSESSTAENRNDVDNAADQRDFTPEEYDQIQKEIDEWTYQEAVKRMGGQ